MSLVFAVLTNVSSHSRGVRINATSLWRELPENEPIHAEASYHIPIILQVLSDLTNNSPAR